MHGRPAFHEQVEAWVHGPVIPAAFYEYRHFRWNPIEITGGAICISDAEVAHIEDVIRAYGAFTATQLEALSHEESPWIEARTGLDPKAVSRNVISADSMKAYFSKRLNG